MKPSLCSGCLIVVNVPRVTHKCVKKHKSLTEIKLSGILMSLKMTLSRRSKRHLKINKKNPVFALLLPFKWLRQQTVFVISSAKGCSHILDMIGHSEQPEKVDWAAGYPSQPDG